MRPFASSILIAAAISLAVATGLGAYASHGLERVVAAARLDAVVTGIEYQFYHSLGLMAVGLLYDRYPTRLLIVTALLLGAGIVLFCGAIYAGALGAEALGPAAPVGGLCLIAAWLVLALAVARARHAS